MSMFDGESLAERKAKGKVKSYVVGCNDFRKDGCMGLDHCHLCHKNTQRIPMENIEK